MKTAFTICSANYLPYAKALGDSFIKYNSDYSFTIVLIDTLPLNDLRFFQPLNIVEISRIQLPEFEEMNRRYNIFELICALKPFVISYFIETIKSAEIVVYFDSDILVYNKLADCEIALKEHPVVLTPHIIRPLEDDGLIPDEGLLLKAGLYNAGFFAVNNSSGAISFLHWWKRRLLNRCFNDMTRGLFVDQLWLSLVPVFFPSTCVLRHPGYNVAYWNFQERSISGSDSYTINKDFPLVFFHFSGYDILDPENISRHQNRFTFETLPEYRPLFYEYKNRVLANRYNEYANVKPAYGVVKDEIGWPKKKNLLQKIFGI